jgi:hypothetical protein
MNRFGVFTVLFLLGSTGFCQTAAISGRTHSSPAPDLSQYRLEEVIFEGGRFFSAKRLYDTFHVPVGDKVNHTAAGQGLERLRELYGDYGYINFTAVPTLQLDKDRGTVVLTISKAPALIGQRKSRVVELRFFGGLRVEETAEVLKVSPYPVDRNWRLAKAWLLREIGQTDES